MLQQETKVWTVRELMKVSIDLLQKKGFDESRLNVELLLAHALKCQRIQLYTNFDKPLSRDEIGQFRRFFERRLNREPLQYIVGSAGFMGLQFRVDQRVLIPRPETETLVEQVMLLCNNMSGQVSICEIGTGSGNIAVSLAKFLRNVQITSIDASPQAIEVAELNAKVHEVTDTIEFHVLDVFEPVDQLLLKRFKILVSNPPYGSQEEWEQFQLEIKKFEPRMATTDGRDGLEFYRRMVELAPYVLVEGGKVAFEVGYGQADVIRRMLHDAGFSNIYVVPDLQDIPRVVIATSHSATRNPGPVN